jgi:hypothetical protein
MICTSELGVNYKQYWHNELLQYKVGPVILHSTHVLSLFGLIKLFNGVTAFRFLRRVSLALHDELRDSSYTRAQ